MQIGQKRTYLSFDGMEQNFACTARIMDCSSGNESSVSLLCNAASLAINGEVFAMVEHETLERKTQIFRSEHKLFYREFLTNQVCWEMVWSDLY